MKRLIAAFCLFVPLTAIAAGAGRPFTIAQLFAEPGLTGYHPEQIEWSPDGHYLTYLLRHAPDGHADLHIVSTQTGKDRVLLTSAQLAGAAAPASAIKNERERDRITRYHVDSYHWAPKSDGLFFLSNDQVYLYSLADGRIRQLTHEAGEKRDPKLSPDGQWVSYVTDGDVRIVSVKGGPVHVVVPHHQNGILNGELDWVYTEELNLRSAYAWSPDSRYIAFLQFDERPVVDFPLVNYTEQQPGVYPQKYPQAGAPNPVVRLGVFSVTHGDVNWMKLAGTDDTYLARFGWLPERDQVYAEVLDRSQTHLTLSSADPQSGATQTLVSLSDPDWIDVRGKPHFLKSGGFVWSTAEDGWQHLYLYSDRGHQVRRLTDGDYNVLKLEGVDEATGQVYFTRYTRGPLNTELYRVPILGGDPKAVTQTSGTHDIDMGPKSQHYLDTWSNAATPPSWTLVGLRDPTRHVLHASAKLDFPLSKTRFITIPAGDGHTPLYARMIFPPDFDASKTYPVIMYQYGGPDVPPAVRDAWGGNRALFDQLLAHDGFILFATDNRAATYFSHRDQALIKHHLGELALQDQLAAVKWLKAQNYVDPNRIGIWGWSYGGYMTTYALTRAPGIWRAGIAVAPVTRWEDYDSIYTERYMGTPQQNPQGYAASSSVASAANLSDPLLLVAGTGDNNVHWQNTMQFIEALIEAGKPYQLLIYPNKLHGISGVKASTHLYTAMEQFWLHQLKPDVQAVTGGRSD
ncbi:MAG TPA: DPP IV N-terminal domain-containing protein [Gammaproteobacteria bacterium]|nr:DPP IV N-terminal domain-containing protein [Gammaproteobacteria bacterium]